MTTGARRCFLGVDVGGTFTDVVLGDSDGRMAIAKVTTTSDDPREGVALGVAEVLASEDVDPAEVVRLVHGTTLATNVILQRTGSDLAFVTTAGFGDMALLGREFRQEDDRFNLFFGTPSPPVPRHRTFEVRERVDGQGKVLLSPDPVEVGAVAEQVASSGATAVAICLLHAYAMPAHERDVAEACRSALGKDAFVVTSSEVWPELREYERAMTTIMCAYVGPIMNRYLAGLGERLRSIGVVCPIEVMESSGGVMSASLASRRPVYTIESGGAAGVIAAGAVGRLIGAGRVISFDMGGTTAKTGVVREGVPDISHDFHVGGAGSASGRRAGSGFPLKIPVVDMAEVGAGGGSIASVDSGGRLRVGPRSSGSLPGPACYGRGGSEPTVTDANLILGYLHPGELSGGVSLSVDLARKALEPVAAGLELDVVSAARAVHDVANAEMAAAIRVVTVQRGIDPRDFVLVSFGGAGPMHAAELADTFGIDQVVVPRAAGVASAVGLIGSDLAVERVRTRIVPLDAVDTDEIEGLFVELEREATSELGVADGAEATVTRSVDVRYRGQAHQLIVPVPAGHVRPGTLAEIRDAFAHRYRDAYGIDRSAPTELVNLRLRLVRRVEKVEPSADGSPEVDAASAQAGHRPVCFARSEYVDTPVHAWATLASGWRQPGPAIVEGTDTTVVVPPGFGVETDRWRNLTLRRDGSEPGGSG